jgi:hypothetical protein
MATDMAGDMKIQKQYHMTGKLGVPAWRFWLAPAKELYLELAFPRRGLVNKWDFRQRGSVAMEYVILLLCFIPVVVGVQSVLSPDGKPYAQKLFNPSGDYNNDFGLVGNAFYESYTNIVTGVSQPVP